MATVDLAQVCMKAVPVVDFTPTDKTVRTNAVELQVVVGHSSMAGQVAPDTPIVTVDLAEEEPASAGLLEEVGAIPEEAPLRIGPPIQHTVVAVGPTTQASIRIMKVVFKQAMGS